MSSLFPDTTAPRLLLAIARTRSSLAGENRGATSIRTPGAEASRLGRDLLSQLAAHLDLDCPVEEWSPRGHGPPRHARLPDPLWACLSHSRELVIAGIADCPLGVDIERSVERHRKRLDGLIEALPEAEVRDAIRASPDPLAAFYRAWTLHEARYKLASLEGSPSSHVLSTRIAALFFQQHSGCNPVIHAWQYQDENYTLSLCGRTSNLRIVTPLATLQTAHGKPSTPRLKLCQVLAPCPLG